MVVAPRAGIVPALFVPMLFAAVVVLTPATPADATTYPEVSITSPANGATVSGTVEIDATASTDPSGSDDPASLEFYVDNSAVGSASCTGTEQTCTGSFVWDSTGLSGSHTLLAVVQTVDGASANSAMVTVTVNSPAPVVRITVPNNRARVTGQVTIGATGSTAASQSDYPAALTFYVDNNAVGSAACTGTEHVCKGAYTWNSTGLSGTHRLQVVMQTVKGLTANSPTVSVTVNSPEPTAAVTRPESGSVVKGRVKIDGTGSTSASQSDYPAALTFYVDNNVVGSAPCTGTEHVCTGSTVWDATGLTRNHVLMVEVTTTGDRTADSAPVTVRVRNPAPQVTITAPANGSSVTGAVKIVAVGLTDASLSDEPNSMTFYVSGVEVANKSCPASHRCSISYIWQASGQSGSKTIEAAMTTDDGVTVKRVITISVPPPVEIVFGPAAGTAGSRTKITGRLLDPLDSAAIGSQPFTLALTPVHGRSAVYHLHSSPDGRFSLIVTLDSNARLVATSPARTGLQAGQHTITVAERAVFGCRLSRSPVRAGQSDTMTCRARYLPNGVDAYLNYRERQANGAWGGWFALTQQYVSKGGAIVLGFYAGARGVYQEEAYVESNRVYAQTDSPALKLVVT